jgi:hypothetical protein
MKDCIYILNYDHASCNMTWITLLSVESFLPAIRVCSEVCRLIDDNPVRKKFGTNNWELRPYWLKMYYIYTIIVTESGKVHF